MINGFLFLRCTRQFLNIFFLGLVLLAHISVGASNVEPREIEVPKKLRKKLKSFEPSGIVYLEATDNYLVASDDTTDDNSPMLFKMNHGGQIERQPVTIEGIEQMTDMESLSQANGFVYVMSSQGRNKKNKVRKERNQFVRGKLRGSTLTETAFVELRSELLKVLPNVRDSQIEIISGELDGLLDIEASFVKNGQLYVGLKDPQPRPGVGLLLELGNVDGIFSSGKLDAAQVKVAAEINFASLGKDDMKISDVIVNGDELLISGSREDGGGGVWRYDGAGLRPISIYKDYKPEGISLNRNAELMVVFDQGQDPALFSYEDLGKL